MKRNFQNATVKLLVAQGRITFRDANPGPLFLIPGFGIGQCPIPGLKIIFCVRNYQYKNNIFEGFLFACLPYANNWISNLWRVLFVSMLSEVKS